MTALPAQRNDRVLIVDDNQAIHEDFRKILTRDNDSSDPMEESEAALFGGEPAPKAPVAPGFRLDSGFQGEAAVALVQRALSEGEPYAMAFMDVRMPPGWDGIETTVRIWEADPCIQIVICTAYSDYSWEDILRKLGQSDRFVILKKPFDNIEVLQLAHSLTRKWQLLQEARGKMANLEELVAARAAQIVREQAKFKMIFDNSPEGIFQTTEDGRLLSANRALADIYGYPGVDDLLSKRDRGQSRSFADVERWGEYQRLMLEEGHARDFEAEIRCRDDSLKWISQTACRVLAPDGSVLYYQGFAVDITARKRAKRERDVMEAHLRETQKLESVGRLAAGIAHEINNPLQCAAGNIAFVAESFGDFAASAARRHKYAAPDPATPGPADDDYLLKEIPTALRQAGEGVDRVARIVRAMSEFSLSGHAEKTQTDLNQSIETTLMVSRGEWKDAAVVRTDFAPDLPLVPCLRGEFNQIMLNLIVNAAQSVREAAGPARRGKGAITITTCQEDGWAVIRVADTGAGIPEKIRARIFEPFFTTKPPGKGTGLGLAAARASIVNQHAGSIHFESSAGRGATFIIRLPLSQPAGLPPADPPRLPSAPDRKKEQNP